MAKKPAVLAFCLSLTVAAAPITWAAAGFDAASTDAMIEQARDVMERSTANKASEKQLEQIVLTLSQRAPTPAARQLIESLSHRQPPILVPHEYGGVMLPYVDVGAAARFALRNWARSAAYAAASRAIQTGDPQFLDHYFASDAASQAGIVDAASDSSAKNLVLYRDELISRIEHNGGDRLAVVFASALSDTMLYERVILDGSARVALDVVRSLSRTTDPETALALMKRAVTRPDIASATLFETGRLAAVLPAAEQFLWDSLSDAEVGGTAAAVLARQADSATVSRLIDLLHEGQSEFMQRRIVLALRLSRDADAIRAAEQWLERHPAALR